MQTSETDQLSLSGEIPGVEQGLADRIIETAWLIGLLAIPVLFTPNRILTFYNDPKYFVLHLVAVGIVVAWAFEWAAARGTGGSWRLRSPLGWAGRRPERWAVICGAVFATSAAISTLASPVPRVSLWGRDFIGLGYELYSFLALLTVFFAVALRLRSLEQAGRVLLVVMIAGGITSLYGLSQNFGWDPIGPGEDFARNFASFGNPIFFGSFLVMASLATVAVALEARRSGKARMLIFAIAVLGVELAGLWISQSRGPLLGMATGVVAFTVIGAIWLGRRTFLAGIGVIAAGIVIAVPIALLPAGDSGGASRSLEELGDIFGGEQSTSVGGRATTWGGALELAGSWERSPEESPARHALRPIVGLGPDMYFYSYPLSIDRDPSGTGLFFAHVHNYPMQVLLELGFLGLGAFLALVLLTGYAGLMILRSEKKAGRADGLLAIFAAVVLAALAGRAAEQMAGVAHVSDLVTFWALAGLIVALAGISARSHGTDQGAHVRSAPARPARARTMGAAAARGLVSIAPVAIAGLVLVLGVGLFFIRDVRGIGASRVAAQGFVLIADGRDQDGLGKYLRAVELNPEVELYVMQVDFMFRAEANLREDPAEKIAINEQSLAVLEKYEDRDPFAHPTQRRIAKTELALGRLGQTERFASAVERYVSLAAEMRSFPTIQALAADGIVAAGDGVRAAGDIELGLSYTELGLTYADRAIELATTAHPSPRAWWVRGVAMERLGRLDEALASFLVSVARGEGSIYESEAHKGLARVYERLGDPASAETHRLLAEVNQPDG